MTYALVCWGGNATSRDLDKLNKLIKKAGSCVGRTLENLDTILEDRRLRKGIKIEKNVWLPLHSILTQHKSKRPGKRVKYILPEIRTDRFGKSFIPSVCLITKNNRSMNNQYYILFFDAIIYHDCNAEYSESCVYYKHV